MISLNYLNSSWQQIAPAWQQFLAAQCQNQLLAIDGKLTELAAAGKVIFPPQPQILRALRLPPEQIKAVILGQDPYHGRGQAMGLAFAVNPGIPLPPSLKNIFKELVAEYNPPLVSLNAGLLATWAEAGVLLLNASLTVLEDQANSLANLGWQAITNAIIQQVSHLSPHCAFLLWGNYARSKAHLINADRHLILEAAHPSPLSATRGFFGCNHFKLANQFLAAHGLTPINWLS